jgi:hypothetical protein
VLFLSLIHLLLSLCRMSNVVVCYVSSTRWTLCHHSAFPRFRETSPAPPSVGNDLFGPPPFSEIRKGPY